MERDLANLRFEFDKFSTSVGDVRHNLEDRLQQWAEYDISFERLLAWLAETEATLKNYAPKSTLEEKEDQLEKYQSLIVSVQQNDADLDKLRDSSTELVQKSGETRISVNVQQITSRFQSIQVTTKEIMKKCEQSVADHQAYLKKYNDCSNWLSSMQEKLSNCLEGDSVVAHQDLQESITGLKELLSDKPNALLMLNSAVELGEKSYSTTAIEGRETIRLQLQELQQAFESLFDSAASSERELQAKLLRWTGFEECSASIKQWLKEVEAQLPQEIELKTTLDEKRAKLQTYRNLLHDVSNHQQDIINLRDKVDSLPEKNDKIEQLLKNIIDQHQGILKRCQNFVEQYEAIVSDHQQYSKAVMDTQEWLDATHNTVLYWEDTDLERISLLANLERLKNLHASLPEEEHRIHQIRTLGEKVIPGTVESGQVNIRSQIDSSQQEWEGLTSAVRSTIEAFENKLQQWNEYESLKDQCLSWIRETDTKLHAVDLKPNLQEKKDQLEILRNLQGEVRAKELEIDAVTERAQQLYKGSISARSSQISELGMKYQQVSHKVKDLTSRWNQYVSTHQEFESHVAECTQWLQDIKNKLSYCSDLSASSQKDLEGKLETIQDSLLYKEEGFSKVQGIVELAQNVLANTAPSGHDPINQSLAALQEEWSILASRMVEIKANLDDSIQRWAGFLEQIHQLNKTVEYIEGVFNELSEYQTTMSEKRSQLERLKCLDEKARCEKIEVESLKSKAAEMLASGQQSLAASQAQEILNKFDALVEKIKVLLVEREDQYRYHRLYKEAQDDLIAWLARAREKVPAMKQRSLSDKLAIESAVAPLEALLNKKAQGELLVEHLHHTGEVVLASTSPQGQEIVRNEIKALGESFEGLFNEIKQQKEQLETMVIQWKAYKEEFERLSDWLQQFDILVKAHKNALLPNVEEKNKQVIEVKGILEGLEKGHEQIDKFNKTASSLLTSHLETYVNNQLRHLNSRYQVQVNLAQDVLKKVETNRDQHTQYEDSLAKAKSWIENAKQVIRQSSEASSNSSKEVLQARLEQIQDLLNKREEAQNLIHMTINLGEKVVRNTRSDGKDIINAQLKEIQTDWDRIVRKISTSKVHLETSLLQWADYSSSYSQLQQWITDREAKLQQVCEQKISKAKKGQASGLSSLSIGERKATLRQTDSIVQDIVSFEPMIQSVTSRAEDLLQQQPASEISTKYETLSKQAKELYARQKETVEQHQAFINAGNDFAQWIRAAKEKLSKCSEPTGDKETLSNKVSQLTVLQSDIPEGQQKLEKALEQGNVACQVADTEDKEIIEEEVALLQEEFDNYLDSLNHTKSLLEIGIVKWTEYEDQYQESTDWLTQTEVLVHSYNKLQDSLEEKKNFLEQFQNHLQTLFDWQKDLDRLNMKAQVLLETCADTRISNAITQMTTKYNALLSLAKEIMKRLELHYQEHQQHNTLYQECQDWLDRTREKLGECQDIPNTLPEVKNKLQVVRGIRQTLEQGQNKLRYALELKEKVILNTEQNGAAKLQEDTDNLKQEFEKLMTDVQDVRQKLTNRASQLEEIHKAHKLLADWLEEIEMKVKSDESDFLNDLSEKRATLEKFRAIQRDVLGQKDTVERVRARITSDQMVLPSEYAETLKKYDDLQNLVSGRIEVLEKQVKEHGDYKQMLNDAIDWVRKTRIDIQHNSDPHGEKEETISKDKKIKEIAETLGEGEKLLNRVYELSETVMDTTGAEGKDTIKQEIRQLKSDWDSLNSIYKDSQKMLSKCLNAWNDFATTSQKMKDWLGDFEKRVEAEIHGENKTTDDLQKCRALLLEALQHKPLMEELNDRCEILMELSACSWVRDQSVQLQGSYTNLLTTVQGLVSRVEKNLSDLTEFIKAKEEFDLWLKRAHGTVQDCIGVGDEESANDKLETIRLVSTRMSEGQHLMTALQDVFAKAVNNTPSHQQDTIRDDMAYLHNSWDQLTMDVNSTMAQLKAAKNRWQDYNEAKASFEAWLKGIETTLEKPTDTKAELGEMKTFIERFKHMQDEVNGKRGEIEHLKSEATELSAWANKPSLLDEEVKRLYLRWEQLPSQCDARRESHEVEMREYLAYHQSLQDTEKWILQVSFQLMAHNSLYITNKQQTQEQISQHEALLEDIQKYQTTLDDLKAKGHGQIERYEVTTPAIRETIVTQLNNVQDSYKSLLSTAIQIKNRLLESLAKFQEYEDTLESIMRNLDTYEPIIIEEVESPVEDLPTAQRQLENIRGLHNKLQAEKARLATAVQACEAAAACISRPSSPQDTVPAPIPDEELVVRARLEDIIDQPKKVQEVNQETSPNIQLLLENLASKGFSDKMAYLITKVQSHMVLLTSTVGQLEEKSRQRGNLGKWVAEQSTSVAEWASRPSKLRPEAAKAELQQMNEILSNLSEKKAQLAELSASPKEADSALGSQLSQLEDDLNNVISKKQMAQGVIEDYRNSAHDLSIWFDQLLKEMEALEKGNGLDCSQKLAVISDISKKFDSGDNKMGDLKEKANVVINEVSNLDSQQVEDQVKSLERRHNDIQKRIHRKAQVLDKTKKGFDSAEQDIGELGNWVSDVQSQIRTFPLLGYERKPAEERQQAIKGLIKDAEGKQVLLQSLEKRINNMQTELENPELQSLENSLKSVSNSHSDLRSILDEEMDKVSTGLENRKRFEKSLDDVRKWLKLKLGELKKLGAKTPLLSSVVDQDISLCKVFENEIKDYGDNNINELQKQANSLLKECEDPAKKQLNDVIGDVNNKYESLKNGIGKKLHILEDLLRKRKDFEDRVENIKHWLNEADIATSAEIRDSTSELLEEQLAKYDKLSQESARVKASIDEIFEIGKSFDPTLSEADKFTLMEDLNSLKDKYTRIAGRINDKVNGLRDTIEKCKEVANTIAESATFMEGLQKEIKELNRPVGSKIEDVESLLSAYEKILGELKAHKSKLEDAGNSNIGELQSILKKQEDLIHTIEGQIAKLRQQLLLREQYIALITEIISFITKYNEIVREIERSGHSVEEKIKRYSDVILRIQECEGLLASASDKGQQIVDEGATAADRNSVTQQLQSLKQQLGALRREVEKRRGEHEATAAEHRKLLSELEEALDDLHQKESTAGSLPLLQRDPASVLEEMEQNEVLVRDVGQQLDKVRTILESVRHDEGLPGPLTERLSEASVLLTTLPRALEERTAYLKINRQYRQEYGTLSKQLHDWIREAEDRLQKGKDGVDFENVLSDLEEHKVFFGGEATILELAQQKLQKSADQIWPSLCASEQEELSREQQHNTQLLKNTLNSARSHRAELEQDAEIWKDYLQTMDRVRSILGRSQFTDEPAATLAGLQFNIQKIKHALSEIGGQQNELDLLNERGREITRQSDPFNCERVKQQIQNINKDWNNLMHDLESRRDTLNNLSGQWKEFENKWQDFESFLVAYEERARHVDTVVRNKPQIEEARTSLHDLLEEVEGHKSAHEEVLFLSGSVLTYLSAIAEPASASLKEKLEKLTKSYNTLADSLNKKLEKVKGDIHYFEFLEGEVKNLRENLTDVHSDILGIHVFDVNQDNTEQSLQELSDKVDTLVAKAKLVNTESKEKYISTQKLVPTDIAQLLSELELLAETVHTAMDEKKQEFKKARTVRYDYDKDVEVIQEWIQKAESKIQDRSVQPLKLKEYLQEIQSGIGDMEDKLERAKKNGSLIAENSNNEKERELINKTITTLTEDLHQVKSWLEDKKHKVGDSLDSWERFMQLYKEICTWAAEKRKFYDEPLYLNNLTLARKKLQDYSVATKTAKQMSRNLTDMTKELEAIRQVTTVEDLPEKLEEATEMKGEIESLLIDKNTLLQELTEEWEQYEKKLRDVKAFMEKSKQSLESPQNKKRPLRDQLSIREKILSEIAIQRKKIMISVEKLQVHFRSIAVGETNVSESADELMTELGQLQGKVKEQNVTLESCLSQVDQCLQEIQNLQQQIVPVEQQLRVVLSPTYSPNDKERAIAEQNACRERIKALQTKITARNERIKLLVQRGTPDSEPLDS
ncbi:muscle-specific protein 300 kDa-like [Hetaerina americana]|uniref:muscle-specific protein 300 kDa-like n=1 Tax=Hetaerina americana TaxID=62018 RepID=UPI003A7F22EE